MSTAALPTTVFGAATPVALFETALGVEGRVDAENGVIYGVKVLGFESRATGRTIGLDPAIYGDAVDQHYSYTREAMVEATPLYEGCRVYIDHPEFKYRPDGERLASLRDRKLEEAFGRLVNVRVLESGMFADLEYVRTHPLAAQVAEMATRFPELLALSHNAKGDPVLENSQVLIKHISDVRSVDLVGERPGTTKSLFETGPRTMADALGAPEAPTVGKTEEQITDAKHGGATNLREDDPVMAPTGDTSMMEDAGAASGAPAADHFDSAFQTEIMNIVQGDGTAQDKIGKISGLLKLQDKVGAIRGGDKGAGDGDADDSPVGEDLEETDPEPGYKPKDDKAPVAEAAPCPGDGKKPMTESAPPAAPAAQRPTTKRANFRHLIESVAGPVIGLMNEMSVPITEATFIAVCNTPAVMRRKICATLVETAPRLTPVRSQAGAVGLHETSPAAARRPGKAPAAPAQPAKKRLLDASSDELLEFAMNGKR